MAKSSKKTATPSDAPVILQIGDKVTMPRAKSVLEISQVHNGSDEGPSHMMSGSGPRQVPISVFPKAATRLM
jgi:hypothetical protein